VRDAQEELIAAGVVAAGISPDKPEKQKNFSNKYQLGFVLLSDDDRATAKAYGAWGEKKMYGKVTEGIIRSAFLIDGKGKILGAWYNVKPLDMIPKLREALSA